MNYNHFIKVLTIALLAFVTYTVQAQYVVTGRVTDAKNGDPLPFATVGIKGLNVGTQTNFEGLFTLKAKVIGDSIFVSSVGYKTRVKLLDKTAKTQAIDFQLQGEAKS